MFEQYAGQVMGKILFWPSSVVVLGELFFLELPKRCARAQQDETTPAQQ